MNRTIKNPYRQVAGRAVPGPAESSPVPILVCPTRGEIRAVWVEDLDGVVLGHARRTSRSGLVWEVDPDVWRAAPSEVRLRSFDVFEDATLLMEPEISDSDDPEERAAEAEHRILEDAVALLVDRWDRARRSKTKETRRAREFFFTFDFLTHPQLASLWRLVPEATRAGLLEYVPDKGTLPDLTSEDRSELQHFLDRVLHEFAAFAPHSGSIASLRDAMQDRLTHRAEYYVREGEHVGEWRVSEDDLARIGGWMFGLLSAFAASNGAGAVEDAFLAFADGRLWIESELATGDEIPCPEFLNAAPDGVFFFGFAELALALWRTLDREPERHFWESMSRLFVGLERVYLDRYEPPVRKSSEYDWRPRSKHEGPSLTALLATTHGYTRDELLEEHTRRIAHAVFDDFAVPRRVDPT